MSLNPNPLHELEPVGRPEAEMAAWDPMDEHDDAGWQFNELDRRGMLLLGQVGAATLVLALATGLATRFS